MLALAFLLFVRQVVRCSVYRRPSLKPPAHGDSLSKEPVPMEGSKGGNEIERMFYLKKIIAQVFFDVNRKSQIFCNFFKMQSTVL